MSFRIKHDQNWYLQDTSIENIYINEYMVDAPGDYVKVFLFARMHAGIGTELSNEMIAMELGIEADEVLKAWSYWESKGVIRKVFEGSTDRFSYDVEFLSLKSAPQPEPVPEKAPAKNIFEDEDLSGLMLAMEPVLGRTLNQADRIAANEWLNEYNADPEVIIYACKIAAERDVTTVQYITGIIRKWIEAGLKNADEVEMFIKGNDERNYLYRRVFKALGFNRNWTENEKKLMDRWFDDYGFTIDRVLEACAKSSGISNPNINYVNKILANWNEESEKSKDSSGAGKKIANSKVLKYYEYIRNRHEEEARARREEVYETVPKIAEIEEQIHGLNVQLSKAMFGSSGPRRDQIVNELKGKMEDLNVEKAFLMTDNNFTPDYMEVKYLCTECQDTGVNNEGQRCSCFKQRTQEAIEWQKKMK